MELYGEVTFHVKDDIDWQEHVAKVIELDREAGNLDEEPSADEEIPAYTPQQIIQVLWHNAPEYLHKHVLVGWTLDKMTEPDDLSTMRSIWS